MYGKTYSGLYAEAARLLDSRFELAQLFWHAFKMRTHELPRKGGELAPQREARLFLSLCEQRREGAPLQYLLGEWEFYGLPFKVGEGVLIPRADTETLVEAAYELIRGLNKPEVLDLCAGSGCVAVALAHLMPTATVTALENSPRALGYLQENIKLNQSPVRVIAADLNDYTHPCPLDLLVSNPPYIPADVIATLQPEVRREPRRALDGGTDGLDFYRVIVPRYKPQLKRGGHICFEVGAGQAEAVLGILSEHGFAETWTRRDLTGIERVVCGRRV